MIYLFLAEGFEEIEALTQADLLRRAGLDIKCVSVESYPVITGAHKIKVMADCIISDITVSADDMILLPGGMPGVENLYACKKLTALIRSHYDEGGRIAAICAAPIILGRLGILDGKMATCYPGFEDELQGAKYFNCPVVVDGEIITAKAAGAAIELSAEIIASLAGEAKADKVLSDIYYE